MGDMNSSLAYSVAFHSIILICGVHLRLSHVVEVVDNDEVDTMLEASPTAARKASAREDRRVRGARSATLGRVFASQDRAHRKALRRGA